MKGTWKDKCPNLNPPTGYHFNHDFVGFTFSTTWQRHFPLLAEALRQVGLGLWLKDWAAVKKAAIFDQTLGAWKLLFGPMVGMEFPGKTPRFL